MRFLLGLLLCSQLSAWWSPYADVEGWVGNYRKGAGVTAFAPLTQDERRILFAQCTLGNFQQIWSGSIGAGLRQLEGPFAWGVNLFGDYGFSDKRIGRAQFGVGAEILGNCWSARVNGYLPQHHLRTSFKRASVVQINGINLISFDRNVLTRTQGYNGFDVEVGGGMNLGVGTGWLYGSYYRFAGRETKKIQGPRIRAEFRWDDLIRFAGAQVIVGGEWDYNRRHGHSGSAQLALRIPIGDPGHLLEMSSCSVCHQMGERVWRNRSIWVDDEDRITDTRPQLPFVLLFVQEMPPGPELGTQQDPMSIATADSFVPSGGESKIYFFLQDGGNIIVTGVSPFSLLNLERIYGFGNGSSALINLGPGRQVVVNDLSGAGRGIVTGGVGGSGQISADGNNLIQGIGSVSAPEQSYFTDGANITFRDLTSVSPVRTAITASGASNVVVDGGNFTNGGVEIGGTAGFTMRNTTIAGPVPIGTSLEFTTVSDVFLSNVDVSGADTDVATFTGVSGQVVVTGSTWSGAADSAGLSILGGSATFEVTDSSLTVSGTGNGVDISGGTGGTIDLRGLTVDATLSGLAFGVLIAGPPTAPIQFGSLTIQGTGNGVNATMGSEALSFDDLSITLTGEGMTSDGGSLTVSESSIDITGGIALALTNLDLSFNCETCSGSASPAEAILIDNVTGRGVIASGTITGNTGHALLVSDGSVDFSVTADISNTTGSFISVLNLASPGSVDVSGSVVATGGVGVELNGNSAPVSISDAQIDNTTNAGVIVISNPGTFTLSDSSMDNNNTDGIFFTDEANIILDNVTITGTDNGIAGMATGVDGSIVARNGCTFTGLIQGISVVSSGSSSFSIDVQDATEIEGSTVGILASKIGSGGSLSLVADGNTFTDGIGVDVVTNGTTSGTSIGFRVSNNTLGTGAALLTNGVRVLADSSGGSTVAIQGAVENNSAINSSGEAVVVDTNFALASDTLTLAVRNNPAINAPNQEAFLGTATSGTGVVNLTLLNNIQSNTAFNADPGYEFGTAAAFGGNICTTIRGNNTNQTGIALINGGSGPFLVTDLANINTNNNGIGFSSIGTLTDTSNDCPLPITP